MWLVALLVALTPALAAAQPKVPDGVKVHRDLAYVPEGHERQKLDIYVPEKADGPLPVIVFIHGGGWRGGSKENCPAIRYTTQGYAVASVNYRLSQHAVFPAQIEDCKAAIRWLRANAKTYNLDPQRFGCWGPSAGGHLVALLGTSGDVKEVEGNLGNPSHSSRVQCVVDWFGPTDLLQMGPHMENPQSPVSLLLGGLAKEKKELSEKANPITYVSRDDPPFLIFHGDSDKTVPHSQSELLTEALKKAGVEVTLVTLKGAGHGGKDFQTAEVQKQMDDFFAKHLRKAK